MTSANVEPPDVDECASWAEQSGLTHPVLVDDGSVMGYVTTGFPTYVVIDREMTIQSNDMWPWDDAYVQSLF